MTTPTTTQPTELPLDERPSVKGGVMVQTPRDRTVPTIHADENGNFSPAQLIMAAIERGIPAEALERLVGLQERMEARAAAKEFAQAVAAFKASCPPIFKSKLVEIEKRDGTKYSYTFAPLEEILPVVEPHLTANGLSIKWDRRVEASGLLTSVCTLKHLNGHFETSSFTLPTENANPGMTVQQKYAGAATFADRKSLQAVLGIVAGDEDKVATQAVDPTPISEDQATVIEDLLRARTKGKPAAKAESVRKRFLKYLDVDSIDKIRAVDYDVAVAALQKTEEAHS
jgi:hypothetical protein